MKRLMGVVAALAFVAVGCGGGASSSPTASAAGTLSEPPAASATTAPSVAAACSGKAFYLSPGLFDEFQAGSKTWLDQYGKEKGLTIQTLDSAGNATQQLAQLDDAIAQKPAAIIVAAVDSAQMAASISKITQAGILAIAYDRLIADAKLDFTVTGDNVTVGRTSAEEVVKVLTAKNGAAIGAVLEVIGDPADSYAIAVHQGFSEVMQQNPDIKVISKSTPGWENSVAAATVNDVLTATPNVDVVYLQSDGMGPAVVGSLKSHGHSPGDGKLVLLAAGGSPVGLQLIRDGWIPTVVEYPVVPEYVGSVDFICRKLAGETVDLGPWEIKGTKTEVKDENWGRTMWIPAHFITKDNVDDPNLWGNFKLV